MGGAVGIFSTLLRGYILSAIILIVVVATVIKVNRMQSLYQRSLVRKVNKIKEKQKLYLNEKDETKLPKLEKKHSKAVKRLEARIKRILRYNRNIVITNSTLIEETNLALPKQAEFTFVSKLDELIAEFNKKTKRFRTINAAKKGKAIKMEEPKEETLEEVEEKFESNNFTEEKTNEMEDAHQISFDEVLDLNTARNVEKTKIKTNKDIYKEQEEDIFNL